MTQAIVTPNTKQDFLRKDGQTEKSPDIWNDSFSSLKEGRASEESEQMFSSKGSLFQEVSLKVEIKQNWLTFSMRLEIWAPTPLRNIALKH